MRDDTDPEIVTDSAGWRRYVGPAVTIAWLVAIAAYVWLSGKDVTALRVNELGDFLAGVFAPVAFLWLVLGYQQQGIELRQNTAALKLQVDELHGSVKHQAELARVAREERRTALAMLQPAFVIEAPMDIPGEPDFVTFKLYNHGAQCDGLRVSIDGDLRRTIGTCGRHYEKFEKVRMLLAPDAQCLLQLTYWVIGLGEQSKQWVVTREGDGQMRIGEVTKPSSRQAG